jgi:hypothetical protein
MTAYLVISQPKINISAKKQQQPPIEIGVR